MYNFKNWCYNKRDELVYILVVKEKIMGDLSKYSDEDIINIVSSDAEAELQKRGYAYGWYKVEPFVGAIYILVNPAFPNLVKIGYADDVQKRVKTLNSNSGLPDPYHVYALYMVKKRLEDLRLHELIDTLDSSLRHSKNREFYEMDAEKAFSILSAIAQINGDERQLVKNPLNDEYFRKLKTVNQDNLSGIRLVTDSHDKESKTSKLLTDVESYRAIPNGEYYMEEFRYNFGKVKGVMRVKDGKFVVEAGATCAPAFGNWCPKARKDAKIENDVLMEDVVCKSPSTVAWILMGKAVNGWEVWKTVDGKPIDIYRK